MPRAGIDKDGNQSTARHAYPVVVDRVGPCSHAAIGIGLRVSTIGVQHKRSGTIRITLGRTDAIGDRSVTRDRTVATRDARNVCSFRAACANKQSECQCEFCHNGSLVCNKRA